MIFEKLNDMGNSLGLYNLSLTNKFLYELAKSDENYPIHKFLCSPLAKEIYEDSQINTLREVAFSEGKEFLLNTIYPKNSDSELQNLVNAFILKRIKRGNPIKAMKLLLSNSPDKKERGAVLRDHPNLIRKDLVEMGFCNPDEYDDTELIGQAYAAHILKSISEFCTQEEEIDVEAFLEINVIFIANRFRNSYQIGWSHAKSLAIKSNMFLKF